MKRTLPALLSLSALLAGCEDSLVSGAALEDLLGLVEHPTEPAWEIRWYAGEEEGLLIDCELMDVEWIETEEIIQGFAEAPGPDLEEPPVWIEGEGFSWSLALLVLVDAAEHSPLGEDEEEPDELEPERGVWGAVDQFAVLFGRGDAEALRSTLLVGAYDLFHPGEGSALVGWVPEIVALAERFDGSLYSLEGTELEELAEYLPITATDYLEDEAVEVLSGEVLGGAQPWCGEDLNEGDGE